MENNLLTEVNRIKEIMGLSILLEGNIFSEASTIFSKIINGSSINDFSEIEKKIVNNFIAESTELQNLGIRSINDLLSDSGSKILIKTLKSSKNEIVGSMKKTLNKYIADSLATTNNNINRIPELKTIMLNTPSQDGTLLNLLQKIESNGVEYYKPQTLVILSGEINKLKTKYKNNQGIFNYFTEVEKIIDDSIYLKQTNFENQIDNVVNSSDNLIPNNVSNLTNQFDGIVGKYYKNIDQEFRGAQLPEITQMITKLDNETRYLDFDTSKIKLVGQQIQNNRLIYEFQHQDGPTFLMYKSTGSNVDSTGKEEGTWWALPGFANVLNYINREGELVPRMDGWFIKDNKSLELVQGNNPFLTNMKQFLESNPNYKFNNEFNSSNKIIANTTKNLLKGKRISNRSFVDSDIDWSKVSYSKNMNDYNKLIAQAIQTGDYQYISRGGFERFGIDDFIDYLMNNISMVHELNPSIGRWSVTFK